MTVPTSDNREQYLGNDSATEFDYAFKIFDADDLVVILTDADDNETTLVRGSDYSVDGVGDEAGGTVAYPLAGDPLATGETLTILREIPVVQETDLRNQGTYYPETLEDELDRSRMIDQQQQEQLGRTLTRARAGNHYDAKGRRIENVGDAVNSADAVNKSYMVDYLKGLESGELGNTSIVDTASGTGQALQDALNDRVVYVASLAELSALPAGELVDGQRVSVEDAGEYEWDAGSAQFVKASVSSSDAAKGAALLGYGPRSVKEALDSLLERRNPIIPPSLPAVTNSPKLIMTVGGETFVVTRKANGRKGYAAMSIGESVAAADAQNIGGASNYRMQEVLHVGRAYVAKTDILSKTAGVSLSALGQTARDEIWGYVASGIAYYSTVGAEPEVSLQGREVYEVPAGESVVYEMTGDKASVRLGASASSSVDARVEVSTDNTAWLTAHTLDLSLSASDVGKTDVEVSSPAPSGSTWYLRVRNNAGSGVIYLPGLNIGELKDIEVSQDVDNALFQRVSSVGGEVNSWLLGVGANEFAALSTDGKFYGTYHGGHSDFLQRLRARDTSYNLDTGSAPGLYLTDAAHLFSASTLTVGSTEYLYTAMTQFGDGVAITHYNIELSSGSPAEFQTVFTHMSTTNPTFDYVHAPVFFRKTDDGDIDIGQAGFVQQYRAADGLTLNTYFSQVDLTDNSRNGVYILFNANYNKQYYGPVLDSSGAAFQGGSFVTAKEFF